MSKARTRFKYSKMLDVNEWMINLFQVLSVKSQESRSSNPSPKLILQHDDVWLVIMQCKRTVITSSYYDPTILYTCTFIIALHCSYSNIHVATTHECNFYYTYYIIIQINLSFQIDEHLRTKFQRLPDFIRLHRNPSQESYRVSNQSCENPNFVV